MRAAMQDMSPGMINEFPLAPITLEQFKYWFEGFEKFAAKRYRWSPTELGVRIECVFSLKGSTKYGLEKLDLAETMLMEIRDVDVHRVRQSASWLKRTAGLNFRITKAPEGINITRLDDDEIVDGKVKKATRATVCRYPLATLEIGDDHFVPLEEEWIVSKLRSCCTYYAKKLRIKVSIKAERGSDGKPLGHRITRTA